MIQIDDVVVSLDVLREKFLCNLEACKGECCIEGDAGAPVEFEEIEKLEEVLPVIWDELSAEARAVIEAQGVNYHRWDVCKAAVLLGRKEDVPVYKFLKEPLIRKFGEEWYAELELAAGEMKKQGML